MIYEKEMFHYLFLHFPIALFCTAFIFELISLIKKKTIYVTFVLWNMGMAIFWSIFSIISGFITDWSLYGHMDNPLPVWTTHGSHMIVATLLYVSIFILKYLDYTNKIKLSNKVILIIHISILGFFIHGTHIGAKLADRL